ncbi:hypothetical protein DRO56_01600 [Candidatus Bathyarchaeota archaeon]|nr:MAG: hypothetical protein DRO56_01600 [Candidatus Bathyarchaeota archaeon]
MNEYARGAFECLSWIEVRMRELEGSPRRWEVLKREVSEAIADIRWGAGIDFRERLRAISRP